MCKCTSYKGFTILLPHIRANILYLSFSASIWCRTNTNLLVYWWWAGRAESHTHFSASSFWILLTDQKHNYQIEKKKSPLCRKRSCFICLGFFRLECFCLWFGAVSIPNQILFRHSGLSFCNFNSRCQQPWHPKALKYRFSDLTNKQFI